MPRAVRADTSLLTVRLPNDLIEELRAAADERVVGVRLLVEYALRGYLWQLPALEEPKRVTS